MGSSCYAIYAEEVKISMWGRREVDRICVYHKALCVLGALFIYVQKKKAAQFATMYSKHS